MTTGPSGTTERDTITCCHCNSVHVVEPKAPVDFCMRCMKPVCEGCHTRGGCTPFEKVLERMEARGRFLREFDAATAQ